MMGSIWGLSQNAEEENRFNFGTGNQKFPFSALRKIDLERNNLVFPGLCFVKYECCIYTSTKKLNIRTTRRHFQFEESL